MSDHNCYSERRELLGFAEAVVRHIEPLVTSLGFHRTNMSCYAVVYESPIVSLKVVHDRLSYGIGLGFQRIENPSERCSLDDILASDGKYRSFQASTPGRVNMVIAEIADLLRRYGAEALMGDAETYNRLIKEAEARSDVYTKKVVQQPIRIAAEVAWQRQDYTKVREFYESIAEDLTTVEKKRLEYVSRGGVPDRVASGGCPPEAPIDPNVRN
jgi:hypothetical protein